MYSSKCSSNSSSLKVIILSLLSLKIVIAEIISTPQGDIQGIIKKTVNDNEIQAFLGIPFARPPIGDLRFKVRLLFFLSKYRHNA